MIFDPRGLYPQHPGTVEWVYSNVVKLSDFYSGIWNGAEGIRIQFESGTQATLEAVDLKIGALVVKDLSGPPPKPGEHVYFAPQYDARAAILGTEPRCECGAASTGARPFAAGHAGYCPVGVSK